MVSNVTAPGYKSGTFISLVGSTSLVTCAQDTMPISKKFIGAVEDEWQLYRSALVGSYSYKPLNFGAVILLQIILSVHL